MRKKLIVLSTLLLLLGGCTKMELEEYEPINLGEVSTTTSFKSVNQTGNVVTVVFETTIGSKYSVQITPFGEETPVIKEGFTADGVTTQKVYNLSDLPKRDYDLTLIDISGKEVKHPIVVK
jgi:PBP1b-binding outer membrane lipoprotein LpoB